jgi:hypothetical protein
MGTGEKKEDDEEEEDEEDGGRFWSVVCDSYFCVLLQSFVSFLRTRLIFDWLGDKANATTTTTTSSSAAAATKHNPSLWKALWLNHSFAWLAHCIQSLLFVFRVVFHHSTWS